MTPAGILRCHRQGKRSERGAAGESRGRITPLLARGAKLPSCVSGVRKLWRRERRTRVDASVRRQMPVTSAPVERGLSRAPCISG